MPTSNSSIHYVKIHNKNESGPDKTTRVLGRFMSMDDFAWECSPELPYICWSIWMWCREVQWTQPTGKTVAILKIYSLGTCRLRPSAENHIDASRFASNFSCASPSTFVLGFSIGAANIHGFHELRYNLDWIISKRAIHGALVSQPWVYTNKKNSLIELVLPIYRVSMTSKSINTLVKVYVGMKSLDNWTHDVN